MKKGLGMRKKMVFPTDFEGLKQLNLAPCSFSCVVVLKQSLDDRTPLLLSEALQ